MSDQSTTARIPLPSFEVRDVAGFPGYRVGDDGSLWTCWKQRGARVRGYVMSSRWRRMACGSRNTHGYRQTCLSKNGEHYYLKVATLVLEAFVGPAPPGMEAAHENGIRIDDRLENLSWKNHPDNEDDKRRHGTLLMGSRMYNAKLTEEQVKTIKGLLREGRRYPEIAAMYGVDRAAIRFIAKGVTWKHVT